MLNGNIRPSIELCCLVVFDLSCNVSFRFFFFVFFVFLLLLPLMANKVVCRAKFINEHIFGAQNVSWKGRGTSRSQPGGNTQVSREGGIMHNAV